MGTYIHVHIYTHTHTKTRTDTHTRTHTSTYLFWYSRTDKFSAHCHHPSTTAVSLTLSVSPSLVLCSSILKQSSLDTGRRLIPLRKLAKVTNLRDLRNGSDSQDASLRILKQ